MEKRQKEAKTRDHLWASTGGVHLRDVKTSKWIWGKPETRNENALLPWTCIVKTVNIFGKAGTGHDAIVNMAVGGKSQINEVVV